MLFDDREERDGAGRRKAQEGAYIYIFFMYS